MRRLVRLTVFYAAAFFLLLPLVACPALQDAAAGAINEAAGDGAQLEPRASALFYFAGPGPAPTRVVIDVQGLNLVSLDAADKCIGTPQHLQCSLGRVVSLAKVELTGRDVSATVSYLRAGVPHFEVLTVPEGF